MKHLGETAGDRSVERLLHQPRDPGAAPARGSCLDVETLAAWADGALARPQRAAAEAHAADCGRCRALIAAMVRTAPSPADAPAPRRRWSFAWLIPATAAAAALAIWIATPANRQQAVDSVTVADSKLSTPATAPVEPGAATPNETVSSKAPRLAKKDAPAARPQSREEDRRSTDTLQLRSRALAEAPPPSRAKGVQEEKQAAFADRAAANELTRAPSAGAEPMAKAMAARATPPIVEIVSSNPGSRWRIVGAGTVQHSTDGGSTWHLQQTGVAVPLTAGISPSPSVCWLVGPAGIVLLTTDAQSWRRITFPEMADLLSVSATDDKTATITTTDGRTFRTTDGGQTWDPTGIR